LRQPRRGRAGLPLKFNPTTIAPPYLGGYFDNLIDALKAGVPKIRDWQGGHGAAPGDNPIPEHIAAFALHLAGANIVLLVNAHIALLLKARPAGTDR
jgi:hypothetical protein